MNALSILIAEDDESVRTVLQGCVSRAGHTTTCVANGREAREALQAPFDLVITDILMPESDGLDVIAYCKQAQPNTRILAISGGGRIIDGDDCVRLARGLGAHAALLKPFSCQELLAGISQAMKPPRAEWL